MQNCDACGAEVPEEEMIYVRVQRPSDKYDLCCVIAGCKSCFQPSEKLTGPGSATAAQWEEYFDSGQAINDGYLFMT